MIHRNLVAVALGQKLAILAADDAELERHSTVSIDACSLPEQITTLYWIAYAKFNEGTATTVFLVRVSSQSFAQCPDTDLSQLHLADSVYVCLQENNRSCKTSACCWEPPWGSCSYMLKMVSCYTDRGFTQLQLRL